MDLQKFQNDITEWANTTFGNNRQPSSVIAHLAKEVIELSEQPYDIEEYADCFILLLNASKLAGVNVQQLLEAAESKMEINRHRKWGKPDENGVVEHLRE